MLKQDDRGTEHVTEDFVKITKTIPTTAEADERRTSEREEGRWQPG